MKTGRNLCTVRFPSVLSFVRTGVLAFSITALAGNALASLEANGSGTATTDGVLAEVTATDTAATASEPAATGTELAELTVTGIRKSVQAAQDIKRDAPSVVEAITTEDLGKFTDSNIADALQRVPGINIERSSGTFDAGYGVTIRGLGPDFSSTTLNGRDLLGIPDFFGAGGRQFDFSTVPPEVLSGVEIYKTSTASQIEPGLSGQVNMQTLRPLDYKTIDGKKYFGSLSASVGYTSQSNKGSPRFGGTVGTKLLDDTLGVYVAGVYSNDWANRSLLEHYAGRTSFSLTDGTTYNNALADLYGYDIWRTHEERTKRSIASGIQWKPSSNWEVNGDFEYNQSGIVRRDQADYWTPSIGNGGFGTVPIPASALTLAGSAPGIVAWDATRIPGLTGYSANYLGALHLDYIDTAYNGGLNTVWKSDDGKLKVSADFAHSNTDYTISWLHPYIDNGGTSTNREIVNAGGNSPVISLVNVGTGPSASDPAAYTQLTYFENFQKRNRGERNSGRLDFSIEMNDTFTAEAGARYSKTDTKFVSMAILNSEAPTSVVNGISSTLNQLPFLTYQTPQVNFAGFCASNPQFCHENNIGKGSLVGAFPTSASGSPADVLGINTGESYEVEETNTAFYGQLDFHEQLFGIKTSGNAGLRAVRITENASAFQGSCIKIGFDSNPCKDGTSVTKLVGDSNKYWEYLPSVNLTLSPQPNINVRFAVARSITLPTYFQLAPIGKADIIVPDANGTRLGNNRAASGNTKLNPTKATNYDFTTEYYTSYGGSYITSLFYKDVKDLIVTATVSGVTIPGQGNILFDNTTTKNESTGFTYGAELGTNQPFTFLASPWDGFGLQANYTYVQSRTHVSGMATQFPGSSKNNINVSTYYEKYGFSARLAYSYRSKYLSLFADGNAITRAEGRLDASIAQRITSNLEVIVTGANLTGSNRSIYDELAGYVVSYYQQPITYTLGVRGNF